MSFINFCSDESCCLKCCEESQNMHDNMFFHKIPCEEMCRLQEACTFGDPELQKACELLIVSRSSIDNKVEGYQCVSSGTIPYSQRRLLSFQGDVYPVYFLLISTILAAFIVVAIVSICQRNKHKLTTVPQSLETEKSQGPTLSPTQITNTTLPRRKGSAVPLIPLRSSSERISIKSKDSMKSEREKSSKVQLLVDQSKVQLDDSFEFSKEKILETSETSDGALQLKDRPKKEKLNKKKGKKKRVKHQVSFTLNSSYSQGQETDTSLVSALTREGLECSNTLPRKREVSTQKRAPFTPSEVKIMLRNNSSKDLKPVAKYEDVDDSIHDMRTSLKDNEDSIESEKKASIKSYQRTQPRKKQSVVEFTDIFLQDDNMNSNNDDDLVVVHNNRKTKIDI